MRWDIFGCKARAARHNAISLIRAKDESEEEAFFERWPIGYRFEWVGPMMRVAHHLPGHRDGEYSGPIARYSLVVEYADKAGVVHSREYGRAFMDGLEE